MESVSIQIPASLFAAIYDEYREESGRVISDCLHKLLDSDQPEALPISDVATPYPRPGVGTITGRVWEIADELASESGETSREAVISACVAEGININTANTQYSYWRNASK